MADRCDCATPGPWLCTHAYLRLGVPMGRASRFPVVIVVSLISEDQREQLLSNGRAAAQGDRGDLRPVVKLFTPDAHAVWLLSELDPADGDTAYGLCDVGIGAPELAHVKLSDLAAIRGPNKLPVKRDPHFKPKRRIKEYAAQAAADGSIND
jgi:hypothetical protein